jgi:hypothetical protein
VGGEGEGYAVIWALCDMEMLCLVGRRLILGPMGTTDKAVEFHICCDFWGCFSTLPSCSPPPFEIYTLLLFFFGFFCYITGLLYSLTIHIPVHVQRLMVGWFSLCMYMRDILLNEKVLH